MASTTTTRQGRGPAQPDLPTPLVCLPPPLPDELSYICRQRLVNPSSRLLVTPQPVHSLTCRSFGYLPTFHLLVSHSPPSQSSISLTISAQLCQPSILPSTPSLLVKLSTACDQRVKYSAPPQTGVMETTQELDTKTTTHHNAKTNALLEPTSEPASKAPPETNCILTFMVWLTWASLSLTPAAMKNPCWAITFPVLAVMETLMRAAGFSFAPGLLEVMQSATPPTIAYFKTLPTQVIQAFGIYLLVLKKLACRPKIYVGTG